VPLSKSPRLPQRPFHANGKQPDTAANINSVGSCEKNQMKTRLKSRDPIRILTFLFALIVACEPSAGAGCNDLSPHKEVHGDLIVLYVCGSYEQMGKQEAELIGEPGRNELALQLREYNAQIARRGLLAKLYNYALIPVRLGSLYEKSGLFDELGGMARAIHEPRADVARAVIGALFGLGSSVFVGTKSSTADGKAIIAHNVDWPDHSGAMKPTAVVYHPTNGDLGFVSVGWALSGIPATGLNQAGLAFSYNFFPSTDLVGLGLAQFPQRLVLEKARTVKEAIAIIMNCRELGIGGFFSLADANGGIAEVECTAHECEVYHPQKDWFAQTNKPLLAEMALKQSVLFEDFEIREAAIRKAVKAQIGHVTPQSAAEILRYRENTPFINGSTVANLFVFNSVIITPAAKVIWISTHAEPFAPFGEFIPIALEPASTPVPSIAEDKYNGMKGDQELVALLREASRKLDMGDASTADLILENLRGAPRLEPCRLMLFRVAANTKLGEFGGADALLDGHECNDAQFELRFIASAARLEAAIQLNNYSEAKERWWALDSLMRNSPRFRSPGITFALAHMKEDLETMTSGRRPLPPDFGDWWIHLTGVPE